MGWFLFAIRLLVLFAKLYIKFCVDTANILPQWPTVPNRHRSTRPHDLRLREWPSPAPQPWRRACPGCRWRSETLSAAARRGSAGTSERAPPRGRPLAPSCAGYRHSRNTAPGRHDLHRGKRPHEPIRRPGMTAATTYTGFTIRIKLILTVKLENLRQHSISIFLQLFFCYVTCIILLPFI